MSAGWAEHFLIADEICPVFSNYLELEQACFSRAFLIGISLRIGFQRNLYLLKAGEAVKFVLEVLKHAAARMLMVQYIT